MKRREYLRKLALMGLLPALSSWVSMGARILKRKIPGTGELLPAIGLGTWETFDVDRDQTSEIDRLRKVLDVLVDKGGSVVDSSPMYGFAEKNVGSLSAEAGINRNLFIATKVWTSGKDNGIQQMNNSLSLLRRDTIDLMQIHNLVDWKTHIKTLRDWKEKGKVRHIGITHYQESAYPEMESILKTEQIDFIQVNYNIRDRMSADRLIPAAADTNVGVIISQPFGYGKLFQQVKGRSLPKWAEEIECNTWAQFFLKFIISHPAVTVAIPGTSNPDHMLDNIQAAYGKLPDADQREMMVKELDR